MRAGQLDRTIVVQRVSRTVNEYGTPVETWADLLTMRAQLVQASTEEAIRALGASDETVTVFRTWYVEGITTTDRVSYDGAFHNIKEIKEIGRRAGLEIRTLLLQQS